LLGKNADMLSLPQFENASAEADYLECRSKEKSALQRRLLPLSAMILWVFGGVDWVVANDQFAVMFSVRCATTIALLVVVFLFYKADSYKLRERYIFLFGLFSIVSPIVFAAMAPAEGVGYHIFGLGVILCFGAVSVMPSAKTTAWLFAVTVVFYSALMPFFDIEMFPLIVNTMFILLIAFASTIGAFARERLERLQAISEAELAQANAELIVSRKQALHARDKEIEANLTKNRFIAGVSHELRTPLNAIIGFSDVMRNELYGAVQPAEYAEYVDFIHSSGQILQTNISDLMDMARIESGKMGWIDANFSLTETLEHAIATCQTSADEAGVSLSFEGKIRGVFIQADPARITQAITNLSTNAIKFTEAGGQVTVSAVLRGDGSAAVSVKDTGRGMNPEALKKIREPFAQAHEDSTTASKGGLGLGLAIVTGILDQLDGHLEIDSDVGVGTCATMIIPADRVISAQVEAA